MTLSTFTKWGTPAVVEVQDGRVVRAWDAIHTLRPDQVRQPVVSILLDKARDVRAAA